jgi:hypothetical protein
MTERIGRDGKPLPNGLLQAIQIDAVGMLRERGSSPAALKARLSARRYLLQQGWTVAAVNEAAAGGEK